MINDDPLIHAVMDEKSKVKATSVRSSPFIHQLPDRMTRQQSNATMLGETSALLSTSSSPQQAQQQQQQQQHGSASVVETIINEAKTCMGTGCLALPYAARVGGVILHVSGLFAIGLWNIYSVHRLCQCLQLIPKEHVVVVVFDDDGVALSSSLDEEMVEDDHNNDAIKRSEQPREESMATEEEASQTVLELSYAHAPPPFHHRPPLSGDHQPQHLSLPPLQYDGTFPSPSASTTSKIHHHHHHRPPNVVLHPPRGTSTYSRVAWYAFGPTGLFTLDLMMANLFIGVVVAFVDATRGFLRDTPVTSGNDIVDAVGIALIIGPLSAVPDIGYLSRASATGLAVLFVSFVVIAIYGWMMEDDNDNDNSSTTILAAATTSSWNWLPENGMDGVSQWFGCVVFGYGIAPLTYNFRESMTEPTQILRASTAALLIVACSYVVLGVGLYSLFPDIDGDVLHTLPAEGWLPVVIRLSMAVVVCVTAPLLILPCGQLVEGKIAKNSAASEVPYSTRVVVRMGIALTCVSISVLVPGFVSVLSLVGCASVAAVGFVVPPLLFLRLRYLRSLWSWDLVFDVVMLLWGVVATAITTSYTFQNILAGN